MVFGKDQDTKKIWTGRKHTPETLEKLKNRPQHFKKGMDAWNYLDGRSINRIKRNNLHHIIWTSKEENLPYIPKGFVIHHLDGNPLNNNYENLTMMPDKEHRVFHNMAFKVMLGRKI